MLHTRSLASLFAKRILAPIAPCRCSHALPELPYAYSALEPTISAEIMELHHKKHHAAYVNNLNAAQSQLKDAIDKSDMGAAISLQGAIRFNGGGHINHSIFWHNLSPQGGGEPEGSLLAALQREFGSVDAFRNEMSAAATGVQGSGWAWLGLNRRSGRLAVATTANQDPLLATTGLVPLLGIDVWEHAYYLQYKNARPEYVKAIWRVINWADVARRFSAEAGKQ